MRRAVFTVCLVLAAASFAATEPIYLRTAVPGKEICLAWNTRNLTYRVDTAGSARTPGEAEFVAIDASFQTWNALSDTCSDFRFLRGPRISTILVGKTPGSADNNVITFREKNCRDAVPDGDPCEEADTCANVYGCWDHSDGTIGLTTTTFSKTTGTIVDADIELNASSHADGESYLFTTISSPPCDSGKVSPACVATDVQNTMTHEIGHAIGLDHVDVSGSTMESSAPPGDTKKRIIDPGTAQGFCDIYPKGLPPMPCDELGQLRKTIVAKNTGTAGFQSCSTTGLGAPALLALAAWLRSRKLKR